MPRYRFTQTYKSSYGAGVEGDEVDLSETEADGINRDAPGTLISVDAEPEPESASTESSSADASDEAQGDPSDTKGAKDEQRTVEHAPNDRQVKKSQKRGAA